MESTQPQISSVNSWLEKPINHVIPKITPELVFVTFILIVTVLSRLIGLGWRVMSHDEVNHVVPSHSFYQGSGYSHDPVTHGPLQFHLVAASYYLFGDTDFTSRIPAALFSIATVAFVLIAWRRYLGRTGALLAGFFFMISPFILYYGRYTRNEAFIGLYGVIMLYAVLRYLEQGKHSMLYVYMATIALHFVTKETSFIYTAEILIFLGLIFLLDVTKKNWKRNTDRDIFILTTLAALLFLVAALGIGVISARSPAADAPAVTDAAAAAIPVAASAMAPLQIALYACLGFTVVSLAIGLTFLFTGLGMSELRKIRSFDLIIVTLTVVIPQLIAFPIKLAGWDPLDYSQPGLIRTSIVLAISLVLSAGIGILWKPKLWLINAGIFYGLFTIFYTSLFTNGQGFFTGLVGSLGYWLSQQAENRGSQPWFFYSFIQIPMYEYLAALGTILAFIVGIWHKLFSTLPKIAPAEQANGAVVATQISLPISEDSVEPVIQEPRLPVLSLLLYWSVISLLAFSVAGEKMPWLTFHITLPMLLASGFALGFIIDRLKLKAFSFKSLLAFALVPIFLVSLNKAIGMLTGTNKPFAGHELFQLQATSTFLFAVIAAVASGWGVLRLLKYWEPINLIRVLVVAIFAILTVTTARSSYQANFINYDNAREFLVYAHAARGPKDVLEQIEDIGLRTGEGKNIKVAYIGDSLYPYWWYFRDYPNKVWYDKELTRDLLDFPVIISDDTQYSKTQAILKDDYFNFPYLRLVWPMQDYFSITFKQVWTNFQDPQWREAIHQIWANKDYTLYAQIKDRADLTLETWQPSQKIYLFVRKDIVSSIWTYGVLPSTSITETLDPYTGKYETLTPVSVIGLAGTENGQFSAVRDIAIAPDGSIYVADGFNHRIQHFGADGQFISTWGTYASVDVGDAPGGTFNEPWGVAVAPDGTVYVTDTWNYRVQKFTADGKFLSMWGAPGTADLVDTFWGPRGIVIDSKGHVIITDTGNNRVVVFDRDGNFITQFGAKGMESAEFYEPVGLAVDAEDWLYVVDTWNQRVQVFATDATGTYYQFQKEWQVSGWDGESMENKPFIDVDSSGNVYVTDPDQFRVIAFDRDGNILRVWGTYSNGIDGFGKPVGIAADDSDAVWIADSENNRLLKFEFTSPQISTLPQGYPALPASSIQVTYNFSTGLVENPLGEAVYRISTDGLSWVPIIPEGILSTLPLDAKPVFLEARWVILDEAGVAIFRWEPDLLLWISVAGTSPTSN
jgi:sugar lactone lactonase YvrE